MPAMEHSEKTPPTSKEKQGIAEPAHLVRPILWEKWNSAPLSGEFEKQTRALFLQSNKYALNAWYNDVKKFKEQNGDYLEFGGINEPIIRPVTHQVFALALSLKLKAYDPAITGVSTDEATRRTLKMIKSLSHHHKANKKEKGWGNAWQSAVWASQAALAGWFLWDEMDEPSRRELSQMLVYEADRFLDYKVPYYRNKEGKIISKGDTKAEENAWNSSILVAACAMMHDHPHWEQWNAKAIELQVSAYSAPSDRGKSDVINGFPLSQLNGSNMNEDGTVVNHDRIHPDYMTAIMCCATNVWIYKLGGLRMPEAAIYNGERVYKALTGLAFKEGTMYISEGEKPTFRLYFPEGNDWGTDRQANYWLMDVMADLFQWDKGNKIKGKEWASVRIPEMARMQNRSQTGQYYQAQSEDTFPSREEWISYHFSFGYLGLWMKSHNLQDFTEEPLTRRTRRLEFTLF